MVASSSTSGLAPLSVRFRVSAAVSALLQCSNVAFCAVLLSWQAKYPGRCRARSWVFSVSQIVLSVARLAVMATSAVLMYRAARAAAAEATLSATKRTKSKYESKGGEERDARAVVDARCSTQVHYDRVLVLNAFVEPAFSLVQLGFAIAVLALFVANFEECSLHEYQKPYIGLSIAAICVEWLYVCLRLAYGSHVITWRGLFGFELGPWEKHFQERLDHMIRFMLCCFLRKPSYMFVTTSALGRAPHPVAMGLAKMFDFRAYGTASMLEFFRAMDHIRREDTVWSEEQRRRQLKDLVGSHPMSERHRKLLLEACTFVRFSSASYTGVALDLVRMLKHFNPFLTLRRQELFRSAFSPKESSANAVERTDSSCIQARILGDNFYGGHTKAFARYACIKFQDVLGGRVGACEGQHIRPEGMSSVTGLLSYFVVRSLKQRTLIIAIRGTADMEDILIDLHAYEGVCLHEDVGLSNPDSKNLKGCGWAHFGVLEATREVYLELMGENRKDGILPRLMSSPEYEGWALRVVGQSLGAAVASLLTLRLRKRYPHIHCFAYNPLPVVDANVVETVGIETCKALVTQLTCNQDVVSRVTFPSVMRLHERVCTEMIKVQQNPWQGDCCKLCCCPDMRGTGAGCNFVCNLFSYCFGHANDHLDDIFDKHGRTHKSPSYVISTPEELEANYRAAQTQDSDLQSFRVSPKVASSAWKPELMRLDTKTRNVTPQIGKTNALLGSHEFKSKSWCTPQDMNFPLGEDALSPKSFKDRWNTLRNSTADVTMTPPTVADLSFGSQELHQESHIALSFGGIRFVLFGEILNVLSCKDGDKDTWFAMHEAPESFQNIILCDSMFVDHMPWHLEAGLHIISERLTQPK
ncbi:triglyceride lipase domain-containing protein [Chloropicon primus]|nr:triglyceride lipase domain-containing protein [Chloropicon primus]